MVNKELTKKTARNEGYSGGALNEESARLDIVVRATVS